MPPYIHEYVATDPDATRTLTPEELDSLYSDGTCMEYDFKMFLVALMDIRMGRWDAFDDSSSADALPGTAQRQLMQAVLHSADQVVPQVEALRAWALHGLRAHHGATHSEIAQALGVPCSTAQGRWEKIEEESPSMWHWARGTDDGSETPTHVATGKIAAEAPEHDE